jgi:hypothetical protein
LKVALNTIIKPNPFRNNKHDSAQTVHEWSLNGTLKINISHVDWKYKMATTAGLSFNKGLYWKFNNSIFLEKTSYSISVCRGGQFYWWRKPEDPEKTTDSDKLYHIMLYTTP